MNATTTTNTASATAPSAVALLAEHIRQHGPIQAVRVSSAPARGGWPYYGRARYVLRFRRDGVLTAVATAGAGSERRLLRLAMRDAEELAARLGAVLFRGMPGPITESAAEDILDQLAEVSP